MSFSVHAGRPSSRPALTISLKLFAIVATMLAAASANAADTAPGFDLDAYKGKVVYLDFWASWCGPCQQSFPYMQKIRKSFAQRGFEVVAVNVDKQRSKADAFLARMNANLPVIYDQKGDIARAFNVKDMPTSILIDREGNVRFVHEGFHADETQTYDDHILELINEK